MRVTRPVRFLSLSASVVVAVTALAGTSFSETNTDADAAREAAAAAARSKRASALREAYDTAREAKERADVQNYLAELHRREQARLAAEAEQARQARLAAVRQRAARNAARTPGRAPAYGNWSHLINQYPWPADQAYRIMMCESGGNANAYNPRSGATGLFQILNGPFDPAENVALAFRMWQQRGWQPWKACL